jgi:hypothetical protein
MTCARPNELPHSEPGQNPGDRTLAPSNGSRDIVLLAPEVNGHGSRFRTLNEMLKFQAGRSNGLRHFPIFVGWCSARRCLDGLGYY